MINQHSTKNFSFDAFPPIIRNYGEVICKFLQVAEPIVGSALLVDLWKKETKDFLAGFGATPDFLKPESPPHPKILMQEPTIEGITKQFEIGWDSLGLFSDE